jgi:IS1 family transposase
MTLVDRLTRCITAHAVVFERSEEVFRQMVWQTSPSAHHYYSDQFAVYETIGYPGPTGAHQGMPNKSRVPACGCFSVEGDNAELRHYLARLGRKSRCFSRCPSALARAVDLFRLCLESAFRLLGEQPTDTLYSLVNAITGTAQMYGMEERFQLEMLASVLVETHPGGQENTLRQRILTARN